MLSKFKNAFPTTDKWPNMIQAAILYNNVVDNAEDKAGGGDDGLLGQQEEEGSSTIGSVMEEDEEDKVFEFNWETPLDDLDMDWAPTASAHCKALELLAWLLTSTTKSTSVGMRSIEKMIERIGGETDKVKRQLGNFHELVQGHGSLADAVQAMLTAGVFVQDDFLGLQGDIDSFSKDLREFAESAKVSSETVLGIIGRIRTKGNSRHQEIKSRMKQLETVLGEIHRPPLPPPTQRTSAMSLLQGGASGIDSDIPLGVASVRGCETVIKGNYLFGLICDLQAKVDVLTERSKNTGVIFQQVAFSSKAEFNYWHTALNSSGSGLAAFMDLVSIWTFCLWRSGRNFSVAK